jgi:hypothetical protein
MVALAVHDAVDVQDFEGVNEGVALVDRVTVLEGDGDLDADRVPDADGVAEAVELGDAPVEGVPDPDPDVVRVVVGLVLVVEEALGERVALLVTDTVLVGRLGNPAPSTTNTIEKCKGCSGGRPGSLGITNALPSVASLDITLHDAPAPPEAPQVPNDTNTTSPVLVLNPMPAATVGSSTIKNDVCTVGAPGAPMSMHWMFPHGVTTPQADAGNMFTPSDTSARPTRAVPVTNTPSDS